MTRTRKSNPIPASQSALPFTRGSRGGILAYAHPLERRALTALSAGFVLLSILYIYFMISSVVHVAARQELVRTASQASAEVAALETAYLAKTQTITEPYARSLGYVAVEDRTFVSKASVVLLTDAR